MDLTQIKELMTFMEKVKIKKLHLRKEKGFELILEKEILPEPDQPLSTAQGPHYEPHLHHFPHHSIPPHRMSSAEEGETEKKQELQQGKFVTSPMVGTYYSSPSPEDPPFVKKGDEVDEETVVCIIEAMKVMNEVKSGIKGRVADFLVENGHPVEFGTKIIRIE